MSKYLEGFGGFLLGFSCCGLGFWGFYGFIAEVVRFEEERKWKRE